MYKLVASSSAILGLALVGSCHEHRTVKVAPPQSAQAEPVQPQAGVGEEETAGAAGGMAPGQSTPITERGGSCPTSVAGTKVNMVDVAGGIALDFTSKANVAALRQRVHQLAASPTGGDSSMNNEDTSNPDLSGGGTSGGGMGGIQPQEGPRVPALATVEDLPDGARLILTPQDNNQLPSLRAQTQAQLPQLDQGDCSGLAIANAQARTPEPKASRVPPNPSDPGEPISPDGMGSGAGSADPLSPQTTPDQGEQPQPLPPQP